MIENLSLKVTYHCAGNIYCNPKQQSFINVIIIIIIISSSINPLNGRWKMLISQAFFVRLFCRGRLRNEPDYILHVFLINDVVWLRPT